MTNFVTSQPKTIESTNTWQILRHLPPPSPTPTSLMRGRHKCMIPNKFTILQNMRYKSIEWFLYGRNTDFKLVHDLKNLVMKFHVF